MSKASSAARANSALSRSRARLAAVQALYQMDMAETDLNEVIDEFKTHRLNIDAEDGAVAGGDVEHFARVLNGVVKRQLELDPMIDQQLATGWRLLRVDAILRAILRAGGFELLPGSVVQVPPQATLVGVFAKPFIAEGPTPLESELLFAHCAPQKFTDLPIVGAPAERSPITNAPPAADGNTVALEDADAGL